MLPGAGLPRAPVDADAVGRDLLDRHVGEVEHHVGREISRRIVDFVEQLLGHGEPVDAPAGAGGLVMTMSPSLATSAIG